MVKSIRLINLNDTSKDDANSFWIGFSTWISQNNVRESLFTEEYVEKTTENFITIYNFITRSTGYIMEKSIHIIRWLMRDWKKNI